LKPPAKKSYLLRLDPRLHSAIERSAAADFRSLNAQVEVLLREALSKRGVTIAITERPKRGRPPKSDVS
jgi:hypothetical protein